MNVLNILLWGLVATAVLTTLMSAAQGLGLSRMSIPFMIGTLFTADRGRATVLGAVVHLLTGWAFALFYAAIFESLGHATVWIGAGFGLLHGLVVLVAVMPVLPNFHPRMATEHQGPEPTRALEPPGFLALNYGRQTPAIALLAHGVYGAILGAGYRLVV